MLLGVLGRCVPGRLVATREGAALAERLIADTIAREGVAPGQLTAHA